MLRQSILRNGLRFLKTPSFSPVIAANGSFGVFTDDPFELNEQKEALGTAEPSHEQDDGVDLQPRRIITNLSLSDLVS